jgi:PRC-barrel domain
MNQQHPSTFGPSTARTGHSGQFTSSGSEDRAEPYLARRYVTARDETSRAGEHRSYGVSQRSGEWNEMELLPMFAVGIGALVAGWLLGGLRSSTGRGRWDERWPEETRSRRGALAKDETRDLIASSKVEGTAVYDRDGERLGSVYNFMVGKRSGQVAYAVMSFGGWLGMGERYHPLPWDTLTYDTDRGGYVVSFTKDRLRNAPSHSADQNSTFDDAYWKQVRDYWR